jgi:predicted TIM-barrel fold metal-dependent hydrolase
MFTNEQYTGPLYQGKIIDAHNHFFYGSSVSDLIKKMDAAGLDKILILSGESMQLYEDYPDRIIPFYGSYEKNSLDTVLDNAEAKLKEGYKGIGEIDLRHAPVPTAASETKNPADSNSMKALVDIAAEYDVPVVVHHESNFEELENLLEYNPNAKVILAHAGTGGMDTMFRMDRILGKYPNLYVDLSQKTSVFITGDQKDELYWLLLPGGKINPVWKHVLEKYPDRFFIGGDYYVEDRNSLKEGTDEFRKVLAQLDSETAEKMAYSNILSILP